MQGRESFRELAYRIQLQARDQADEEARRIPWQLLEEARRHYIEWQEFYYWARSLMESEGAVLPSLAEAIENRCPGFLEDDSKYSKEHPDEGFRTPVRLGFWIDDHVFGFAKKGGWFRAITFYAVRDPRCGRASVCWSQCVERWTQARPLRYPSFEEWLAEASQCDHTANLVPEIREAFECSKMVSPERLDQAVTSYIDWEAFAYWCRSALERGLDLPEVVVSELQNRCPGFLEYNEKARTAKKIIEQDWHRLMIWIADHFFGDAKREGWFDAILISTRDHPRAIRTMEYWEHCDAQWASSLPVPYPSFEHWRHDADGFIDLGED